MLDLMKGILILFWFYVHSVVFSHRVWLTEDSTYIHYKTRVKKPADVLVLLRRQS